MHPTEERFIRESSNLTLQHADLAREVRLLYRDHPDRVILPWLTQAGKAIGFTGDSIDHGAGKILADLLMNDGWMHFHPEPVVKAGIGTVNAYQWTPKSSQCFGG